MYPIPEYVDFELWNHERSYDGGKDAFRQKYRELLNRCIDLRYRQRGFGINYAVFRRSPVSDVIELKPKDRIIKVKLDFKTHTEKKIYPDEDFILDRLGDVEKLWVAGFHLWDCVERLAKRAYERGIETCVDEDLTELFVYRVKDSGFCPEKFPAFNPRELGEAGFEAFMETRKGKPWLWQNY